MKRLTRVGLVLVVLFSLFATNVSAAPAYPALSRGSKGLPVWTAQKLLLYYGYPVDLDGIYGGDAEYWVKQFQRDRGIETVGVVGPKTWGAILPTLRRGSRGGAVVALQRALNETVGYGLHEDGIYGYGTEEAVQVFQTDHGLEADGIAGRYTWSALLNLATGGSGSNVSRGDSRVRSSTGFVELPTSGPGFYRYHPGRPDSTWGRADVIDTMQSVFRQWANEGNGARIGVGDISRINGGYFDGHASHQQGRDADISPVRNDGAEDEVYWWDSAYSRTRTQRLVDLLLATGKVELIFFNDSNIRGVTPWPGHDEHLHVRFY